MHATRSSDIVCFGPFNLDLRAGELHRNGRKVRLHEQPFKILEMLLEHPGEVVTRQEIRSKLWPNDTIVEFDHSINAAIKKVRLALEDSAEEPEYVETVARRGYRLKVPVDWVESSPAIAGSPVEPEMCAPPGRWLTTRFQVGFLIGAAITALAVWVFKPRPVPSPQPISRFVVAVPRDTPLDMDDPSVVLSPDGTHLVYAAVRAGTSQLYLRALDQMEGRPIPGSQRGHDPFFSPDGQWLGFFADSTLKKVPITGGPPVVLCGASFGRGGSWGENGIIIFAPEARAGLYLIPAAGGTPRVLTTPDYRKGETGHRWPHLLPGGNEVLFSILMAAARTRCS